MPSRGIVLTVEGWLLSVRVNLQLRNNMSKEQEVKIEAILRTFANDITAHTTPAAGENEEYDKKIEETVKEIMEVWQHD